MNTYRFKLFFLPLFIFLLNLFLLEKALGKVCILISKIIYKQLFFLYIIFLVYYFPWAMLQMFHLEPNTSFHLKVISRVTTLQANTQKPTDLTMPWKSDINGSSILGTAFSVSARKDQIVCTWPPSQP